MEAVKAKRTEAVKAMNEKRKAGKESRNWKQ
jgi:hypothetical protein